MTKNTIARLSTSVRITPHALALRDALAAHLGISKSAVIEQAIRTLARLHKPLIVVEGKK